MTVPFRILSLLLCLLMAGPMSLPAHAVARSENRVGKFFPSPLKSASADLDQTLEPRWECRGCGYDFASGVCKYLYAHADPVNNTDPSGNESLIGISLAGTLSQGLHGKYDAGVSTVGNSLKNTIIGVYSGMSVNQILLLNFLDNAGGVVAGKVIGKLAQLRRLPGVVKGFGRTVQGGRWLQGSHGNAGFVPAQVAQRLAGRQFKNFDEFREAFWREVAGDADLSKAFSPSNVARMREGNAPIAHPTQWVGGKKSYELHHAKPIQHGGEVYDVDNIVVVTPRYHQDVLEPAYHY